MATATWRDAEIDLAQQRLKAIREAVAALDNIAPWLTRFEQAALTQVRQILASREAAEQESLDRHEAELRREAS